MTGVKLTVVGCSGSFPGPDSPASCYLVEAAHDGGTYRLVLDLGSGALGALQRFTGLRDVDAIALSHLHPDHCLDMCGMYVVSKYHPEGPLARIPVLAPRGAGKYLANAYGIGDAVGMTEQFDFREWRDGVAVRLGPFTVTPMRVDHPLPTFAMRIECGPYVLVYSGDTGPTDDLVDLVRDADLFLCEASFVASAENPPHLHLTGADAGSVAARGGVARLLVTHIPAWNDRDEVAADVRSAWDGDFELVEVGSTYTLGSVGSPR